MSRRGIADASWLLQQLCLQWLLTQNDRRHIVLGFVTTLSRFSPQVWQIGTCPFCGWWAAYSVHKCKCVWSRRVGCLRFVATPISFRRAIVASTLGSLALRFGATTFFLPLRSDLERPRFFCLGGEGASTSESMVACTLSSRVSNRFLREGGVGTTEDKFVDLARCKLFDACLRTLSLADANEFAGSSRICSILINSGSNPFSKTAIFSLFQAKI